jgi:hypothetical protein
MQHYQNVVLAHVEEVNDRFHLVFRHFRTKHKGFEVEPVQEYFQAISSHHIFSKDHCFPFTYCEFDKREKDYKFVDTSLTKSIEMLCLFKVTLLA